MARPLRIEYPNAIYHIMARGNGRQAIFHSEGDYERMNDGLEKTVGRTDWRVLAYVWMPNHIHLFLQTPKPNLSKGMQYLLSGYANWYAKQPPKIDQVPKARVLSSFSAVEIIDTVAKYFETTAHSYQRSRSSASGRDLAAWMNRKTTATLRDLASHFGLSHPDSVSNLIRRAERELAKSARMGKDVREIEALLEKTENRV